MVANAIVARPQASALLVRTYTADAVQPRLLASGFVGFNLDTGRLTLSFSEAVDVATFDTSAVTLQNSYLQGLRADGLSKYSLAGVASLVTATARSTGDDVKEVDDGTPPEPSGGVFSSDLNFSCIQARNSR
jgi:hypothetical protein